MTDFVGNWIHNVKHYLKKKRRLTLNNGKTLETCLWP